MRLIHEIIAYPILITYVAGANNYSWLHFRDGHQQLVSKSLRYFEKQLPTFLRVHKTALVNPQYVQDWQAPLRRRMAGTVRMQGDAVLPVGRRRWEEVVQKLTTTPTVPTAPVADVNYHSIVFLTGDLTKALLLEQTLEQACFNCQVHVVKPTVFLPDLLRVLPDNELPVLILLDARTAMGDGLAALQGLKSEPRTAFIPTLLLVPENAGEVIEKGYTSRANSVVVVPNQAAGFVQTVGQLARYWLSVTALPLV